MVREVEINNTVEAVKTGNLYPPYVTDSSLPMLSGYLGDSGKLLTVEVNREVASKSIRLVHLWYAAADAGTRRVDYTLLETKNLIMDTEAEDDSLLAVESSIHVFDVSSVMTIPRRVRTLQPTTDITIDLFTYEANITSTDGTALYGKKRLSMPYSATTDPSIALPPSTDGWYPLGVVDYAVRDVNQSYSIQVKAGDIVWWYTGLGNGSNPTVGALKTGQLYVAQEDTEMNPNVLGKWEVAEESDILRFMSMPFSTYDASATAVVGANIMITRYVKHVIIYDLLKRITYKDYDDEYSLSILNIITAMREEVVSLLEAGDPIRASYMLDKLNGEYEAFTSVKNERTLTKLTAQYTI